MEHVILPFERTGLLQGKLVARSFNDAQHSVGAGFIRAYGARIYIGKIETDGTEPDLLFHVEQALGQVLGKFLRAPENVEGHSGR